MILNADSQHLRKFSLILLFEHKDLSHFHLTLTSEDPGRAKSLVDSIL